MNADQAILRLLKQHHVTEQSELLALLEQEGHQLTQSTLSRRLRRLSVAKLDGRYQHMEMTRTSMTSFTLDLVPPNLVVMKVGAGQAQSFGIELDRTHIDGLVGTVAGDDTILLIVYPPERLAEVRDRVEDLFTPTRPVRVESTRDRVWIRPLED